MSNRIESVMNSEWYDHSETLPKRNHDAVKELMRGFYGKTGNDLRPLATHVKEYLSLKGVEFEFVGVTREHPLLEMKIALPGTVYYLKCISSDDLTGQDFILEGYDNDIYEDENEMKFKW